MALKKTACEKHPGVAFVDQGGRMRCPLCSNARSLRYYHRRGKFCVKHIYAMAKTHARSAGRSFTITLEEFSTIISQPCVYRIDDSPASKKVGLDRKDNTVGYVQQNIVPCCQLHNAIKSDIFSYEQMLDLVIRYSISCGNRNPGRRRA